VTPAETVRTILGAADLTQRIQQLRLVPELHGTASHIAIYAEVARRIYLPALTPDFAYIHPSPFYDAAHFHAAYVAADRLTAGFTRVDETHLAQVIAQYPPVLLVFRTLLGLAKDELAHASVIAAAAAGLVPVKAAVIDSMERAVVRDAAGPASNPSATRNRASTARAEVLARTICQVMDGTLFGAPPTGLRLKQAKPDTADGWKTVRQLATEGVPLEVFLHQRHYGGAFRQILDATSTRRGDMIEDAVQGLFEAAGIDFVRTGSHNQAEVAARFGVRVTPAPDFVVFDPSDGGLRAMLECKGTNNGGTARDKALRFERLRAESVRLGGVPLFAVLGGIGWARINDALAPVVRDTEGRVFTLSTLAEMLQVAPFPGLLSSRPHGESPEP